MASLCKRLFSQRNAEICNACHQSFIHKNAFASAVSIDKLSSQNSILTAANNLHSSNVIRHRKKESVMSILPAVSREMCTNSAIKPLKKKVQVHFVLADGGRHSVDAKVGDNLLDVIIDNDVDIDGFGACEGTLACSTCHLVFKSEHIDKIPNAVTDEELDMLDLAYGLCDTSRLGCQVVVTPDMDGWEINVPTGMADARG